MSLSIGYTIGAGIMSLTGIAIGMTGRSVPLSFLTSSVFYLIMVVPLLLINGKDDKQTPIQDLYLLLEHGDPKSIRIFPGGHMGQTPSTLPTIVKWLADRIGK